MRAASFLASACAIFLVAPGALADAGGPDDAPGDYVFAWDVPLGAFNGTLGGNDTADWYRVDASADEWLVIRAFVPVAGLALQVRADNGTFLSERPLPKGNTTAVWMQGQVARVGIRAPDNSTTNGTGAPDANYTLDLRGFTSDPPPPPEPTADFAITNMWIENVRDLPTPITTDMGQLSSGTRRIVHVAVFNQGNASGSGLLVVNAYGTVGASHIGSAAVQVPAGEVRHVLLEWNAMGSLGSLYVEAAVLLPGDPTPSDNQRAVEHYVVARTYGVGVAYQPPSCLGPVCATDDGNVTARSTIANQRVYGNATASPPGGGACTWGWVDTCTWASV